MEKRLNIRVSDATYNALVTRAKTHEATIAHVIREALRLYFWPRAKASK